MPAISTHGQQASLQACFSTKRGSNMKRVAAWNYRCPKVRQWECSRILWCAARNLVYIMTMSDMLSAPYPQATNAGADATIGIGLHGKT